MIIRELITLLGFKTDEKSIRKYEKIAGKALKITKRLAIGAGVAILGIGVAAVKAAGDMEGLKALMADADFEMFGFGMYGKEGEKAGFRKDCAWKK